MTLRPVMPVKGKISSSFGPRVDPVDHTHSLHNGIDIAVPVGTEVVAPWHGIVKSVFGNDNSPGGFQLVIEHPKVGLETGYAHLKDRPNLNPGDKVKQGRVVAYTGGTGTHTTGPHLHFVIRKNGVAINPGPILKTAITKTQFVIRKILIAVVVLLLVAIIIVLLIYFKKKSYI